MKKIIALLLAAILCLALGACGKTEAPSDPTPEPPSNDNPVNDPVAETSIDTAGLFEDLQKNLDHGEELTALDASMMDMLLTPDTLPTGTVPLVAITSVSNVRVGVFTCTDESAAAETVAVLSAFLERMMETNQSYLPEEAGLIENGTLLTQYGNVVVLCVNQDTAAAQQIIDGYCAAK